MERVNSDGLGVFFRLNVVKDYNFENKYNLMVCLFYLLLKYIYIYIILQI